MLSAVFGIAEVPPEKGGGACWRLSTAVASGWKVRVWLELGKRYSEAVPATAKFMNLLVFD